MNLELLYPALYGGVIGAVLSVILGIYSTPTASKYSYAIFGTSSSHLLKYVTIFLAGFSVAILAGFSALIRDTEYPVNNPLLFTSEVFVAAILPAVVLLYMTYMREKPFTPNTGFDFSLLCAKFGLVHVLLQFSGVYGSVFSR